MILPVPSPSAVSKAICARYTCFCGLFRSASHTSTVIPSRMSTPLGKREDSAALCRPTVPDDASFTTGSARG